MNNYINESECETSFCLLGYLAKEDDYPILDGWPEFTPSTYPYTMYSEDILGIEQGTDEWEWLFSEGWGNNLEHAKARCKFVIENGHAPDYIANNELWDSLDSRYKNRLLNPLKS